jgi:hypothetical protein
VVCPVTYLTAPRPFATFGTNVGDRPVLEVAVYVPTLDCHPTLKVDEFWVAASSHRTSPAIEAGPDVAMHVWRPKAAGCMLYPVAHDWQSTVPVVSHKVAAVAPAAVVATPLGQVQTLEAHDGGAPAVNEL